MFPSSVSRPSVLSSLSFTLLRAAAVRHPKERWGQTSEEKDLSISSCFSSGSVCWRTTLYLKTLSLTIFKCFFPCSWSFLLFPVRTYRRRRPPKILPSLFPVCSLCLWQVLHFVLGQTVHANLHDWYLIGQKIKIKKSEQNTLSVFILTVHQALY